LAILFAQWFQLITIKYRRVNRSGLARDFGVEGAGPVTDTAVLRPAPENAFARLKASAGCAFDVVVNDE
jgi:hypothetical protein